MTDPNRRGRLIMEFKRGDSILVHFGDTEVEITLAGDNPSNKARLVFQAPKSVEIVRVTRDEWEG